MKQIIVDIPVQKSPVHPPPATATVAGILRPPLTTVGQHDHVAAATYLMKHAGTTDRRHPRHRRREKRQRHPG